MLLPSDWHQARLSEVTIQTSKWNPKSEPRHSIQYVDVSAVSREDLRIIGETEYPGNKAPGRARKIVHSKDTILATIRPTLRRIAKIPEYLDGEVVSTAFCVLRCDPKLVEPDFLFFATQLDSFTEGLAALETGASYPAVRDSDVLQQQILLPPISEQKNIASVLNIFRLAIQQQSKSILIASALKRATMQKLFTCGLRDEPQKQTEIGPVPKSWSIQSINDHFSVTTGGTPSRRITAFWAGGTIPWVKTTEIDYRVIRRTKEYITQTGMDQSAAKLFPPGTLLLAMYGQGVTRGKVAILGIEAACNQACAAINSNDNMVDTKYLYYYLSFRYEVIRSLAHGGQQQNLNLNIVRDFPVAYPNKKDEQCEIVTILDAIDHKINLHQKKRAILDDLFKTLLHELMIGKIHTADLNIQL